MWSKVVIQELLFEHVWHSIVEQV